MPHTASLTPLRDVIQHFGLSARKSLGQHFLLDGNITAKIVRCAGEVTSLNIIEIGPGPGGLTRSLLAAGAHHVYAIERDERCITALAELSQAYPERFTLIAEDALAVSLPELVPQPRAIVANLPYNIGTVLLIKWLGDIAHDPQNYRSLTLMFQKEVAQRIVAAAGDTHYGRLSVLTQWLCDAQHGFDLPASAFTPPPKVDSTILTLVPLSAPRYPADKKTLEAVTAAAFGQRRKMLRSSLKSLYTDSVGWLETAHIDPTRRAETLSIQEFCRLASVFATLN